ncbi:hypothetical protein [Methylobacterium nigriterrae]|uniref:hypothetical protein n=1 Tax=Methylobacterium nigriterrae TaxID=3127512 RepID=UPI0030132B6D
MNPLKPLHRWLGRRRDAAPFFTIFNSGVLVELLPSQGADAVAITVQADRAAPRTVPIARVVRSDRGLIAVAKLESELFSRPGTCTLGVAIRGRLRRRRFEIGPGCYCAHIDGVRDSALEGWISPLFPGGKPDISLLVDGVPGGSARLDRLRPELIGFSGQGGWDGFRLPLPRGALDGRPHRLGVRAGAAEFDFGEWTSKPRFHVDSAEPDRLSGWFFDEAACDAPATLRIVAEGRTVARIGTGFRADLKAVFGREAAGFVFRGCAVAPGSTLVAGPEGSEIVLGRFEGLTQADRVARQRAAAQDYLAMPGPPAASRAEREAIRGAIVAIERADPETRLAFQAGPDPAPPRRMREGGERDEPGPIPRVCVIVPVQGEAADLGRCLEALTPQLDPGRMRAIVMHDRVPEPSGGTDPADQGAEGPPGLTILHQPDAPGWSALANRAIALLEPGEDALILSPSAVPPPGFAERLARHCGRASIATVSPLANTDLGIRLARRARSKPLPPSLDAAGIDRALAAEGAGPAILPAGDAACLYLARAAIDDVGAFSDAWTGAAAAVADWCLRARDLGWRHLGAADVFAGGSRSDAMRDASRLDRLYPEHAAECRAFAASDPFSPARLRAVIRLLAGRVRRLSLHLAHADTEELARYLADIRSLPREPDHEVAVLTAAEGPPGAPRLRLALDGAGITVPLEPVGLEELLTSLEAEGATVTIQVNSRLGFPSEFLRHLQSGARPYTVRLHDFQWYCPRVDLIDGRNAYCGEPPPAVCQTCIASGIRHTFADEGALIDSDLEAWLAFNAGFLKGAEHILAPCRDTANRYAGRMGLQTIAVLPHPEPDPPTTVGVVGRRAAGVGGLRVAVVGARHRRDGSDLIRKLAERAAQEEAPLFLVVLGAVPDAEALVRHGNASVAAPCEAADLRAQLRAADPDLVFLPSLWPQPHSYALSEVWEAGYPILAFDLGEAADRIRDHGGGLLIPPTRDTRELLAHLLAARDRLGEIAPPAPRPLRRPSLADYERTIASASP